MKLPFLFFLMISMASLSLVSASTCPSGVGYCNPNLPFLNPSQIPSPVTSGNTTNFSNYWTTDTSQSGLIGTKSGDYNLVTTGNGTFGSGSNIIYLINAPSYSSSMEVLGEADFFNVGHTGELYLGGGTYNIHSIKGSSSGAGYFTDGTNTINLADGTYAINSIGNNHFEDVSIGGANSVNIISGSGNAGEFTNSYGGTVNLAGPTYIIDATGISNLNGRTLINGATDDGSSALQVNGGVVVSGVASSSTINDGNARFIMATDYNNNPSIELQAGKTGFNKGFASYIDFALTDDSDYNDRILVGDGITLPAEMQFISDTGFTFDHPIIIQDTFANYDGTSALQVAGSTIINNTNGGSSPSHPALTITGYHDFAHDLFYVDGLDYGYFGINAPMAGQSGTNYMKDGLVRKTIYMPDNSANLNIYDNNDVIGNPGVGDFVSFVDGGRVLIGSPLPIDNGLDPFQVSNSGYEVSLARNYPPYGEYFAARFLDGTNTVKLSDGTYAIDATGISNLNGRTLINGAVDDTTSSLQVYGQSHFGYAGSTTVDILDGVGHGVYANTPGYWEAYLSGSGGAGWFNDAGGRNVYLANGNYAIEANGQSLFTDGTRDLYMMGSGVFEAQNGNIMSSAVYPDGGGNYWGHYVVDDYTNPSLSVKLVDIVNGYAINAFGAGYFNDSVNSIELADGTYAIDALGISHLAGDTQIVSGDDGINFIPDARYTAGNPSPEIDFMINGARKMVFGYDEDSTRGIFYSDNLAQGLYFYDGSGIGIGSGVATYEGSVFRTTADGQRILMDNSGSYVDNGVDVLQVNGNTRLTGNLNQTNGNATINNYYGEMYNKSDTGFFNVDLVTPDVYVALRNLTTGNLNGFNVVGGTNLSAQISGLYHANAKVSVTGGSPAGDHGMKLFVDGTGQNNCYDHFNVGGDQISMIVTCLVRVNAGSNVSIRFDDHTNPVTDLVAYGANVNLVRIGN